MGNYTDEKLQKIWEKGIEVKNYDKDLYRKDVCGAWMKRDEYGRIESNYGWEVDHKKPESLGGSYELENLRPMQWANNRNKEDDYPVYTSVVTSEGDKNVNIEREWEIKQ